MCDVCWALIYLVWYDVYTWILKGCDSGSSLSRRAERSEESPPIRRRNFHINRQHPQYVKARRVLRAEFIQDLSTFLVFVGNKFSESAAVGHALSGMWCTLSPTRLFVKAPPPPPRPYLWAKCHELMFEFSLRGESKSDKLAGSFFRSHGDVFSK